MLCFVPLCPPPPPPPPPHAHTLTAIEALGSGLESLSHGLQELNLSNCKVTPRAASQLAHSMKQNKNMQYTLVDLDLSGNLLAPDPLGSFAFIQEPNTISRLNLSRCGLNFEFVSVCVCWELGGLEWGRRGGIRV